MLQSQLVVFFYNISSLFILQILFTLKIGVHKIFWNSWFIFLNALKKGGTFLSF